MARRIGNYAEQSRRGLVRLVRCKKNILLFYPAGALSYISFVCILHKFAQCQLFCLNYTYILYVLGAHEGKSSEVSIKLVTVSFVLGWTRASAPSCG